MRYRENSRLSLGKVQSGRMEAPDSTLIPEPEIAENSHDISYRENQPLSYRLDH